MVQRQMTRARMTLALTLCLLDFPLWILHRFIDGQMEALWYGYGYLNGLRRTWALTRYYWRWIVMAARHIVKGSPSWYSNHYGVD